MKLRKSHPIRTIGYAIPLMTLVVCAWLFTRQSPQIHPAPEPTKHSDRNQSAMPDRNDVFLIAGGETTQEGHLNQEHAELRMLIANQWQAEAAARAGAGHPLPHDFIDQSVNGQSIRFQLPNGDWLVGDVDSREYDGHGIQLAWGRVTQPSPGSFLIQRQTIEGVAGPFVGHVLFDDLDQGWKIEPDQDGKIARFVPRNVDAIVCRGLPADLPHDPGDTNDDLPLHAPQTHPTNIPIPHYQAIIPLQSLPGAVGVIYLDFDGEQGPFPGWGDFDAAPSGASNSQIFQVWQRVAEDFQGFNLNITTDRKVFDEAPAGRKQQIIITPTTNAAPGAGGVAYVGSYNWSTPRPCWSFYTTGKNAAEVISHEIGHTLNLLHHGRTSPSQEYYAGHGSGDVGWAPIMGVGYSRNLTQWSRGEYLNANRPNQNDLAIIVTNNSVAYRTDDYGDTLETAGYLEIFPNNSVSNEGIIERTGDVDAFRFQTNGGSVNLNINPVSQGPNLDIHAEIINAQTLAVMVQNNPDTALNANLSTNLPPGEYLMRVRGTGRGDPLGNGYTNYASLGSYLITGTVSGGILPDRFAINENPSLGATIGNVTPRNNHGNTQVTFTIESGNINGAMAIDPNTGQLTVANPDVFDFESLSSRWDDPAAITPFISITNPQNPSLNESIRVVVTVNDVNEPPTLTAQSFTLLERTSPATSLPTITASDPDRFDQLTYSITGGTGASIFSINPNSGILTFTPPLIVPQTTTFDLQITVTDSGGLSTSESIDITVIKHNAPSPPGSIKRLFYTGITGSTVADLITNAKFPNQPDVEVDLNAFDGAPWGDNFGSYIRGYFIAPATGEYRFAIASDDASSLRLATDGNPQMTTPIASVSTWTNRYEWTRVSSQRSTTFNLTQGQVCYIEALHKEGTGGDHVAVAFTSPLNADWQVIPGYLLAPHYENSPPSIVNSSFAIRKNAIINATVGMIEVNDPNEFETAEDFTILSGNDDGFFGIDPQSGRIFVAKSLADAEAIYTLTIQTTDSGFPPLQGTGTVTIQVQPSEIITTSSIIQQIWSNITGDQVSSLTNNPNYPFSPSSTRLLANGFNSGTNIADNYGSRIRALVIPPASGSYTFYLSSDDEGRLFMSTSDNPAQASLIASINNSWAGNLQFDKFASQTSTPRNLVAGQRYYIETLQKEGGGGDHVQVAWTGPGIATPTIIPASALEPFDINTPPVFAQAFYSFNLNALSPAGTIIGNVSAADPEGEAVNYAISSGNINNTIGIHPDGALFLIDGSSIISQTMELTITAQDRGINGVYPLKSSTTTVNLLIDGIDQPTGDLRTVSFDPNDGSSPPTTSKWVVVGGTYGTLPSVSRSGYTFAGWFTAAISGNPITSTTTVEIDQNHTIFAQWTPNQYTVTFDANGGFNPIPSSILATIDSNYGTLATTTRNGHNFIGWATAPSGGITITAESIVTTASDHTLYAQWQRTSDILTKANNTNTLSTAESWVENAVPDNTYTLRWDQTVTAANGANLGGNLDAVGLEVINPGGEITIGNGSGGRLTIGNGGINMHTATQNLTINCNLGWAEDQDWIIAGGRSLTLLDANRNANGSGNIRILASGSGISSIRMSRNGNNATWADFSGNINVGANVKVQSEGQHHAAWGPGGITLNGGTIAQNNGSWAWSTPIAVTADSVIATDSSSGLGRTLKLLGNLTSENASGLTFTNTTSGGTRTDDVGFILAGATPSTYGTTTISANSRVRVGGNSVNSIQSSGSINPGTRGSLGTGNVTLTASTSELAFTRTDAHTVANSITGSGNVVIGGNTTAMAETANQVVTLAGTNTYTGSTRVRRGRLNLTGSLTSAITLDINASISGTGTSTGRLTMNTGTSIILNGGEPSTALTVNGVTFNQPVNLVFEGGVEPETTYEVLNYGSGGVINPENLTTSERGSITHDSANQRFIFTSAPLGFTRTWNTTSGIWEARNVANFLEEDQRFYNGDHAVFGDIPTDAIITLNGVISPGSVTVTNETNGYIFTGSAISGPGQLTKTGDGNLTLSGSTSNTFNGLTTVSGGTLILDKENDAIAIAGDILVTETGTLTTTEGRGGQISESSLLSVIGENAAFLIGNNQTNTLTGISIHDRGTINIGNGTSTLRIMGEIQSSGGGLISSSASTSGIHLNNGARTITIAEGTLTISAPITQGGLIITGGGKLALTASNNYNGNTTVTDGTTMSVSNGGIYHGGYQGNAVIQIENGSTLELAGWNYNSSNAALGGLRNNANAIVINGGTIRMLATSAYGRGMTIQGEGATLLADSGATWTLDDTGDGNIPITYQDQPSLGFGGAGNIIFNKAFDGTGTLTKFGPGSLTLQSTNAFSGGTILNDGIIRVENDSALGSGILTVNQGTLGRNAARNIANPIAIPGVLSLGGTGQNSGNLTIAGTITGSGTLNHISGITILSASNEFSGTIVLQGTPAQGFDVVLNHIDSVKGQPNVHMTGGRFILAAPFVGHSANIGNLSGTGGIINPQYNANQGVRTIRVNQSIDATFAGNLQDGGGGRFIALTKTGPATLTLAGTNQTYTGQTTILEGTLALGASGVLANTPIHIAEATLATTPNTTNTAGSFTPTANATLALAENSAIGFNTSASNDWSAGTVTITGNFQSGASIRFGTNHGGLTINQLNRIAIAGFTNIALDQNGYLTAEPVSNPFDAWAIANGLDGSHGKASGFRDDPDGDGVPNGLEWILGGNPLDGRSRRLMEMHAHPLTGLTLTFKRNPESLGMADLHVDYHANLDGDWDRVLVGLTSEGPDAHGISITIDDSQAMHEITVNIPAIHSHDGRLFARLSATPTDSPDANKPSSVPR